MIEENEKTVESADDLADAMKHLAANVKAPVEKPHRVKAWTDDDEQTLFVLRHKHGFEYRYIGEELGRSTRSCEWKNNNTAWNTKPWYDSMVSGSAVPAYKKRKHLDQIARTSERRIDRHEVKMDIVGDKMVAAVQAIPKVPKPYVSRKRREHSPEDVGLILGDSHVGQSFTFEETGGIAEYNTDIFLQRAENLKLAIADIHELHSQLYELPTIHIFSIGDIVAGMNTAGAWSAAYIVDDVHTQAMKGAEAFADIIHHCLHLFGEVKFYGVYGNHGRGAQKGLEKEYINWDYLCYQFLQARFADNPRVTFVIPKTWWLMADVRNHKFMVLHGDDTKGSGTTALSSLVRDQNELMTIIREIPDYTLIGHFHSAGEITTNNGKVLINGSFMGPNVYALKNLKKSAKPEQKIFGIHDNRGITWRYDINLDIDR